MAISVGQLLVDLKAEIGQFTSNLDKADSALRSATARMDRHLRDLKSAFDVVQTAAGALGLTLGTAAIVNAGRRAIEAAGGLGELADQLGVTAEDLQVYEYAASQAGVRTESLHTALRKLTQSIGAAAKGEREQVEAFRAFNTGITDADGKTRSHAAILRSLAEGYARSADKTKAADDIVKILGRSGQELIPVLQGGAAAIDGFGEAARAAGQVHGTDLVQAMDQAADAMAELERTATKLWERIVALAAPTLTSAMRGWTAALSPGAISTQIVALNQQLAEAEDRLAKMQGARPGSFPRDVVSQQEQRVAALRTQLEQLIEKARAEVAAAEARDREAAAARLPDVAEGESEKARRVKAELAALNDWIDAQAAAMAGEAEWARIKSQRTSEELEAGRKLQEERDRTLAQLAQETVDNERLIAALKEGGDAYEKIKTEIEILNKLKVEKGELDEDEIRRAKELAETLGRQRAETKRLEDANADAARAQRDLYHAIGTAAEDAIIRAKSLKDVLRGLVEDIQRILLRKFVTKPLEGAIDKLDFGGIFGSLFGGSSWSGGTSSMAGLEAWSGLTGAPSAFASGVDSAPPGLAIVGEAGPELVAFGGGERVFDSAETAGMLGGRTINIYADLRGASVEAVNALTRWAGDLEANFERKVAASWSSARSRGMVQA